MAESFDRDDWTGVRGSRLPELPAEFVATRNALHQVAFFAMSPARYQVTGRMGLRATPGGFGTPEYEGKVARVEGLSLVLEERDRSATQTITTLREAARFFGVDYRVDWFQKFRDPLEPMDPDETLQVDEESARVLAHWFGFGSAVLGELRAHAGPDEEVSEVQLWPEHFDPAIELGAEDLGRRASYGASPGDPNHAEPYFYVSAWGEIDRDDPYWNDPHFNGSSLPYSPLTEGDDPEATVLDFLRRGRAILRGE
jgi:hypothetical protein